MRADAEPDSFYFLLTLRRINCKWPTQLTVVSKTVKAVCVCKGCDFNLKC